MQPAGVGAGTTSGDAVGNDVAEAMHAAAPIRAILKMEDVMNKSPG